MLKSAHGGGLRFIKASNPRHACLVTCYPLTLSNRIVYSYIYSHQQKNMITSTFFIVIVTVAMLHYQESRALYLPKRAEQLSRDDLVDPKKRPFCNAFTGCGRKRSNLPALTNRGEPVDESIGSLLELSAEPAVEDLSRQIMSEAKLWEAIQEANVELARRKQESALDSPDNDPGTPARSATASCALPPCYI